MKLEKLRYEAMKLEKLRDQLKNWIDLQIAEDIVNSPFQRSEYSPFVVVSLLKKIDREDIPSNVLKQIEQQIEANKKIPQFRLSFWTKLFRAFKY